MTLQSDVQSLTPGATTSYAVGTYVTTGYVATGYILENVTVTLPTGLVILFELDCTALGGTKYYFHDGTNEFKNNIIWNGQAYTMFPVDATGFDTSTNGALPRPTLRIANVSGLIGSLAKSLNDLVGAKLIRKRTLSKYLDEANFKYGNIYADPTVFFSDDTFYVNRKVSENNVFMEFELTSILDLEGVKLPRRQIIPNTCTWTYDREGTTGTVATVDYTTDIFTSTNHGLKNTDLVVFSTTGTLPAPLISSIYYYVINSTANTFQVSATKEGSPINIGNYGIGTHKVINKSVDKCPYVGAAVADKNDVLVGAPGYLGSDYCSKRLTGCKLRFGTYGELPFGGFPGANLLAR